MNPKWNGELFCARKIDQNALSSVKYRVTRASGSNPAARNGCITTVDVFISKHGRRLISLVDMWSNSRTRKWGNAKVAWSRGSGVDKAAACIVSSHNMFVVDCC